MNPTELFSSKALESAALAGTGAAGASFELISVSGLPGVREGVRLVCAERASEGRSVSLHFGKDIGRINADENMVIRFYAKGIASETGVCDIAVGVRAVDEPFGSRTNRGLQPQRADVPVGEWRQFVFDFTTNRSTGDKDTIITFQFGYLAQTLEIAGISLKRSYIEDYVNTMPARIASAKTLNRTITERAIKNGSRYDMSAGQSWRVEADTRIELYRKGELSVRVRDTNGRPVEGAEVHVEMKRHAFGFGGGIHEDHYDTQARRQTFLDMFNMAVPTLSLKWPHAIKRRSLAVPMVEWLNENGVPVRGHALIWGNFRRMPEGFEEKYKDDPAGLKKAMDERVRSEVEFWGDRLIEWDVFNEPYANHTAMKLCGWGIVDEYMRLTKELAPNVKAYINDAKIVTDNIIYYGDFKKTSEWYYNFLKDLIANGTPLDGIGLQMYIANRPDIEEIVRNLDKFASLGREVKITEFCFHQIFNLDVQAEYFHDILTAAFACKANTAFIHWWPEGSDFDNMYHAGYFNFDVDFDKDRCELTPMGDVFAYLVFHKWRTEGAGCTGSDGVYRSRAFYGYYDITVTLGNRVKTFRTEFLQEGQERFREVVLD